ncbi:MAG: glycosyl hydrolase family 65 protein [Bacteroidota bacterium]
MEAWKKSYKQFDPNRVKVEETLMGLSNGLLQSRAYFAEGYSGDSSKNSYLPPYAMVHWAELGLEIDGEKIDLAKAKVEDYEHQLNMREGNLKRSFTIKLQNKHHLRIECTSFCALEKPEIIGLRYSVIPLNLPARLQLSLDLKAPIKKSWREVSRQNQANEGFLLLQKNQDYVCSGMRYAIFQDAYKLDCNPQTDSPSGHIRHQISLTLPKGSQTTIYKFTSHLHSGQYPPERLLHHCQQSLSDVFSKGFTLLLTEQAEAWRKWWDSQSLSIEASQAVQQYFWYNHFQLKQLAGKESQLLPSRAFNLNQQKGQDWGQEVYLLPYYLWQGENRSAQQILESRYNTLAEAQKLAAELGFERGAALYPAQSWYGRETEENQRLSQQQIFRNGLIAWAIKFFHRHTGDTRFLAEKGAEILIAIARFFADRVNYSPRKQLYVLLATTGPNEYESSVSNNWLTNYLCQWTLTYAVEVLQWLRENEAVQYAGLIGKTDLDFSAETRNWERIAESMYLPQYEEMNLILQQDGFLDKVQLQEIPPNALPLWQNWSEDRRLRSPFLQQADVLWAFYLFPHTFDPDIEKTTFQFFAPKTVHEAPLSRSLHSILLARQGEISQALQQLTDAHEELEDPIILRKRGGLNIPSLAGPFLTLVNGFVQAFVEDGNLHLKPQKPKAWDGFAVKLHWLNNSIRVKLDKQQLQITNRENTEISLVVAEEEVKLGPHQTWQKALA